MCVCYTIFLFIMKAEVNNRVEDRSSYHVKISADLFRVKRARNPRFSLRSFAKQLHVSPAQLSQLLSEKRRMTAPQALKIAETLKFTARRRRAFFQSVHASILSPNAQPVAPYRELTPQEFASISDWHFYAILSLFETLGVKQDEAWVARRLGLARKTAQHALKHLEYLGLIEKSVDGYKTRSVRLTTQNNISQTAVRETLKQGLDLARTRIDTVEVLKRDCSSITMAINPNKIHEAKVLIQEFRRDLSELLESDPKSEVYQLNIQLIPLTVLETLGKKDRGV